MKYDKLIRDKVPDIIRQKGERCVVHTASPEEYDRKLREKLREEVDEYIAKGRTEELADILEVINALAVAHGIDMAELEKIRHKKAEARGRFEKRIILDES